MHPLLQSLALLQSLVLVLVWVLVWALARVQRERDPRRQTGRTGKSLVGNLVLASATTPPPASLALPVMSAT